MKLIFSKNAIKFLDSIAEKETEKLRIKVIELYNTVVENNIIPFRELNIKKLDGSWKGFYRMRSGKIRIIFKVDKVKNAISIYEIDYRGSIYK